MCHLCKTKPVYEFTNKRKLCKRCYVKWFEKKVLYTIRRFGMLKRGDVIGYARGNDFRSVVLEEVLRIVGEKGFKITGGRGYNKFAIPLTIDLQAYEIFERFVEGDVRKALKEKKGVIAPLRLFLDKEIELYAKLKGLKFDNSKRNFKGRERIRGFIDSLEHRHPEVKRAIVNGLSEFSMNYKNP